jgi:DNA-binding transcriptional MerR regulator
LGLKKDKKLKMYYSIGEVASMFGVTETSLRFWEKEFPSIKPKKAGRGIRQYSSTDIEEIRKVHHLVKDKGMTLEGARNLLKRNKNVTNINADVISRLRRVRDELQEIGSFFN